MKMLQFVFNWLKESHNWAFLIAVFLFVCLLYSVAIPIYKVGYWRYLGEQKSINPITARLVNKYLNYRNRTLSEEWYNRVERINKMPQIEWVEDLQTSSGISSFYCLDEQSEDVRSLLLPKRNMTYDKMEWWMAQQKGNYRFHPQAIPIPLYDVVKSDSSVRITTGKELDTWIYLVAKQKQPTIFAIEFDFIPYTQTQETLQLCFASSSLASRFRFNLENNETLKFDIVDKGTFLYWNRQDLWKNFKTQWSLPLGKITHVRLECVNNQFGIYYNGVLKMAVRIKDYVAKPNYWYLIGWNGIEQQRENQDMYMDWKIINFKILHMRTHMTNSL